MYVAQTILKVDEACLDVVFKRRRRDCEKGPFMDGKKRCLRCPFAFTSLLNHIFNPTPNPEWVENATSKSSKANRRSDLFISAVVN